MAENHLHQSKSSRILTGSDGKNSGKWAGERMGRLQGLVSGSCKLVHTSCTQHAGREPHGMQCPSAEAWVLCRAQSAEHSYLYCTLHISLQFCCSCTSHSVLLDFLYFVEIDRCIRACETPAITLHWWCWIYTRRNIDRPVSYTGGSRTLYSPGERER